MKNKSQMNEVKEEAKDSSEGREGDFLKHLLLDVGAMTPGATGLHFHAGYLHFGMQTPDRFRALVFFIGV